MKFSIIIPVKEINDYILKFVPIILKQTEKDFEIIILPNKYENPFNNKKIKIIESGEVGPAKKRDIGAREAKGEILAFIDDDAYPDKNWLQKARKIFENKDIDALGGPNLTPPNSNYFQKLSGNVLASFFISGPTYFRYKKAEKREIDDFPSCNLFVRRNKFLKLGGFDTKFWPGEDTKLCLEIKKQGRIIYDPEVIVFHHRRKDLQGYIKQIFSYSKHRGFFARNRDENSYKLSYFIPSLFVIGLIFGGILSLFSNWINNLYLLTLLVYSLIMIIQAIKLEEIKNIIPFFILGLITHIVYGVGFLKGFFIKELKSKYR